MPRVSKPVLFAVVIAAMTLVGCVRRKVEGDTSTYSTRPWAVVSTALGAVAAVAAGWYVRRRKKWRGAILMAGGVLVLVTTVPGLALSRTLIDPDHVEWNRGFHRFYFRFDELAGIDHAVKSIPIGDTIEDVHYLDFTRKTGETTHVQVEPGSDRYIEEAIPEILRRARGRGVRCTGAGAE